MDAFEAYIEFLALSRHFTSDYDGFKYNFKVRANQDSFLKRHDRYQFHKLSRQPDPRGLIISTALSKDTFWVTDLFDEKASEAYTDWKRRTGTLKYCVKSELTALGEGLNEVLKVTDGQYPKMLRAYMGKRVSPETLVIVDDLTSVFKVWDRQIQDDVFWPSIHRRLSKYKPFMSYDRDEMRKIIVDIYTDA